MSEGSFWDLRLNRSLPGCCIAMKRRHLKIRCKAKGFGSHFNSDYRLQHNREKHEGRNVPFETADAVSNPFEAAKRRRDNDCRITKDLLVHLHLKNHQTAVKEKVHLFK